MSKQRFIQIESKNALVELLREGRDFERIYIASSAYRDDKTKEIVELAEKKKIPIIRVPKKTLMRRMRSSNSESVVGMMFSQNEWKLNDLLESIYKEGKMPFFLILDHIKYTQNIAAVMRTAFAVGVNGIITQPSDVNLITDETIRISMGAAERIPLVEMDLFTAVKVLKKNAIKIFGVDMDGKTYFESDLTGACAFVLGAEDTGISTGMMERVDETVSIPMREGIGSLNVSVSAGVLMYEKLRQEVS
ncbi:23S rRNA (guanosine(2251)-2'-O)-methyltransferase RlmB [candidate division WS6 bacterium RIFOXYB1_FULL_33_14]|uniref:23S rRNA (Guanosine(2251)-2'-O)-methyltransferase RlmB n=1 Tax=candidate division WS6 bacterium RIFOXYB1_FULL_33_14 TaxID=1817896 RepID=A0A1F4UIP3_9BACT|nr:MAG: 23S rRNA (guanosine(2251)-2'-O)-methyltransferase RlmB [candidate division WS6 bacterium RIFOXYB1_FULL_33_14]